ncbi:MAG: YbaN family protein [Spirochaetes bacterium]|nr:YbaN family protein [Spirochaetota bacterium]MBU0955413.1 YbaN family protein [Spirochaetota bacterium]
MESSHSSSLPAATTATLNPSLPELRAKVLRILMVSAGNLSVGLAILGVFLPVLPTTPFLLLAAACYLRSSRRLYRWLLNNRVFGRYLRNYREGKGLPLSFKIWTVVVLWLSLGASALWGVPARLWWVRLLLLVTGITVSTHVLRIKTFDSSSKLVHILQKPSPLNKP